MTGKPGISVVIPCYNSAHLIHRTLEHLVHQNAPSTLPWEVILVNNASTDDTVQKARNCWPQDAWVPLRIVDEPKPGISHARCKGFQVANYEFISFVDDDNFVSPSWIKTAFDIMSRDDRIGACGGYSEPLFESQPPAWFDSFWTAYTVGPPRCPTGDITESRGHLWGAGSIIRKTAWEHLQRQGFTFHLTGRCGHRMTSGEDLELFYALRMAGWRLWQAPDLFFHHYLTQSRLNWTYLTRVHQGFGASAPILYMYRYFLESDIPVPVESWLSYFLKTTRKIIALWLYLQKYDRSTRPGNPHWLRLASEWGTLMELWHLKRSYSEFLAQIKAFHDRLSVHRRSSSPPQAQHDRQNAVSPL